MTTTVSELVIGTMDTVDVQSIQIAIILIHTNFTDIILPAPPPLFFFLVVHL